MAESRVREWDRALPADADAFRSAVAEACEPVVLRGLCQHWPATKAAAHSRTSAIDYLLRFDSGAVAQAFIANPDVGGRYYYSHDLAGFNFERKDMAMAEAVRRIAAAGEAPESPTVYVGSIPADNHFPGFAEQNRLAILPPSVRPRIWLGNASSVACHYDTYDNLACVVAGQRTFTLYPPDAIGDLYVGPIDHTMAGQPVSLAAGSAPGDRRYPRFEAARGRALTAELQPGDGLYLPKLWWHRVEAMAPFNVLVNFWWDGFRAGPDAPYSAMMLAMIAIAERPPQERAAWRAFFDHYVFRPDGHPLAHLPEDKHGILGPLAQGNYGRLRAAIMQALRGG